MSDTRTIRNWAARLNAADEQLTLEEAQTLALISANDRLVEVLGALQDIQMRVTRLELYASAHLPGYDQETTAMVKALSNGKADPHA